MRQMRNLFFLFFLSFTYINGFGQIVHNADTVLPVKYQRITGSDSIYVVYGPGSSGFSDTLSMTAISPYGEGSLIEWYTLKKNSEETESVMELIKSQQDALQLSYQTITQGAYVVRFSKNDQDTSITRWAYFNNLIVELTYEESCHNLFLEGIQGGFTFDYFNPDTVINAHYYENGLSADWRDYYLNENTQQWEVLDSLEFDTDQTNQYFSKPPMEYDTYMFRVIVIDSLGYRVADSIVYEAIAVKADLVASQYNEEIISDTLMRFEAPLYLGFKNKSVNAELYQWTFYNDSARYQAGENEILRTSEYFEPLDSVLYKYPGYYDVKLKVEGRVFVQNGEERACVDSVRKRLYVTVYNSFVGELPNFLILTDDENRNNSIFYFKDIEENNWDYIDIDHPKNHPTVSIRSFKVFIYNRYGMRVYHYEGAEWTRDDGWDGKHNGQFVGTGVYYYVIQTVGYDGRTFEKKGFFHVFRSE